MSLSLHALLLAAYAAVAAVVGMVAAVFVPTWGAIMATALAFLACLVGHLFASRGADRAGAQTALVEARRALREAQRALAGAEERIAAARAEMEAATGARNSELVAELQLLHGLLMRMAARGRPAAPDPAETPTDEAPEAPEAPPPEPDGAPQHGSADGRAVSEPPPAAAGHAAVRSALEHGGLALGTAPVAELAGGRTMLAAAWAMLADGRALPLADPAAPDGIAAMPPALGEMLLFRAAQNVRDARRHAARAGSAPPPPVLVAIGGKTLRDEDFFRPFAAFLTHNEELAEGLILVPAAGDLLGAADGPAAAILAELASAGFAFAAALDPTDLPAMEPAALAALNVRHARMAAAALAADPAAARDLAARLDDAGISLIAGGVAEADSMVALAGAGVALAEGPALGLPLPLGEAMA